MTAADTGCTIPGVTGSALTGRAAAEALGLHMRLGASDARFDARRVAAAARTSLGRARVAVGLSLALRVRVPAAVSRPRGTRQRPAGRVRRAARADASPGRPADAPEGGG